MKVSSSRKEINSSQDDFRPRITAGLRGWHAHKPSKTAVALVACFALQACGTAPTRQQADGLERATVSSDFKSMAVNAVGVGKLDGKGGGDLLWEMNAGAAYLHGGDGQDAVRYFDFAEDRVDRADTASVKLDSAYRPRVHDTVMINTYKALSFLSNNDKGDARVEFNRTYDRQRRAVEFYEKEIAAARADADKKQNSGGFDLTGAMKELSKNGDYQANLHNLSAYGKYAPFVNPLPTYLSGIFFLNSDDRSDAAKARTDLSRVVDMTDAKADVRADLTLAEARANGRPVPPMVWVVFENGQSAEFSPYNVTFPVPVLGRNGVTASVVTVALPKFEPQSPAYEGFDVHAGNNQSGSFTISDFDSVMGAEFNKRYPTIVATAVAEVALKIAAQSAANRSGNGLLQLAAVVGSQVSTVDTRSWTMLPKRFDVARVATPADGSLQIQPRGGTPIIINVTPGKPAIVMIKAMRPGSPLAANVYPL